MQPAEYSILAASVLILCSHLMCFPLKIHEIGLLLVSGNSPRWALSPLQRYTLSAWVFPRFQFYAVHCFKAWYLTRSPYRFFPPGHTFLR